jgi:hypothetical protein
MGPVPPDAPLNITAKARAAPARQAGLRRSVNRLSTGGAGVEQVRTLWYQAVSPAAARRRRHRLSGYCRVTGFPEVP